jgi:hypothetical protein
MAQHNALDQLYSKDLQVPLRLERLCDELNRTARLHLDQITTEMATLAPHPGVLVYVQVHKLAVRMNNFEPVVFSAIDASTLLQVAQVYLTTTTAAATSFIDFMAQSFPFKVSRITTRDEKPFVNANGSELQRDFSAIIKQRGLAHTVIAVPSHDALFLLSSKLTYSGISEGSLASSTEGDVQRDLAHFLFFHNNYRSVPWLEGKTPVQKLGSFDGYRTMDAFDPYASIVSGPLSVRRS